MRVYQSKKDDSVATKQHTTQYSILISLCFALCTLGLLLVHCRFESLHHPSEKTLLLEEDDELPQRMLLSSKAETTDDSIIPLILLMGQSNMQGFSDQAGLFYSGNGNGLTLTTLLPELRRSNQDKDKVHAIQSTILKVKEPNRTIAEVETSLLLDLQHRHPAIFNDISKPKKGVYCYYESFESHDVSKQDATLQPHRANPLQAQTTRKHEHRCGEPWGLELTLGHLLPGEKLAIVKLAAGNTKLYQHWSRYYDECVASNSWSRHLKPLLHDTAMTDFHPDCSDETCRWSAIVWFQGESDTFEDTDAEKYAQRLPRFLNHLRDELHQTQRTLYSSPWDIPVVVIGIGPWRSRGDLGQLVQKAQQEFVKSDDNAAFVSTDDLSDNYHFEAASMLILGDRVSTALESLSENRRRRRLNNNQWNVSPVLLPEPLQPNRWTWNHESKGLSFRPIETTWTTATTTTADDKHSDNKYSTSNSIQESNTIPLDAEWTVAPVTSIPAEAPTATTSYPTSSLPTLEWTATAMPETTLIPIIDLATELMPTSIYTTTIISTEYPSNQPTTLYPSTSERSYLGAAAAPMLSETMTSTLNPTLIIPVPTTEHPTNLPPTTTTTALFSKQSTHPTTKSVSTKKPENHPESTTIPETVTPTVHPTKRQPTKISTRTTMSPTITEPTAHSTTLPPTFHPTARPTTSISTTTAPTTRRPTTGRPTNGAWMFKEASPYEYGGTLPTRTSFSSSWSWRNPTNVPTTVSPTSSPSVASVTPTNNPTTVSPTSSPSVATVTPTNIPTIVVPTWTPSVAPVICVETSAPSEDPSWELIFSESFEQGLVHFVNMENDVLLSQQQAHDGSTWSARVINVLEQQQRNATDDHLLTTRVLDISNYSQLKLTFWFYGLDMKQGEGFHLEWAFDDGNGWMNSNAQWKFSINFDHNFNEEWIQGQVMTPTFGNAEVALRFVRNEDSSGEVFLDNVAVKGMQ